MRCKVTLFKAGTIFEETVVAVDYDDAKKVAAKLIESGYDAYIQKANFKKSNEVWFRIRVGSYDNRQTASAVAESLSKTQKETAWVDFVRYEN